MPAKQISLLNFIKLFGFILLPIVLFLIVTSEEQSLGNESTIKHSRGKLESHKQEKFSPIGELLVN